MGPRRRGRIEPAAQPNPFRASKAYLARVGRSGWRGDEHERRRREAGKSAKRHGQDFLMPSVHQASASAELDFAGRPPVSAAIWIARICVAKSRPGAGNSPSIAAEPMVKPAAPLARTTPMRAGSLIDPATITGLSTAPTTLLISAGGSLAWR